MRRVFRSPRHQSSGIRRKAESCVRPAREWQGSGDARCHIVDGPEVLNEKFKIDLAVQSLLAGQIDFGRAPSVPLLHLTICPSASRTRRFCVREVIYPAQLYTSASCRPKRNARDNLGLVHGTAVNSAACRHASAQDQLRIASILACDRLRPLAQSRSSPSGQVADQRAGIMNPVTSRVSQRPRPVIHG